MSGWGKRGEGRLPQRGYTKIGRGEAGGNTLAHDSMGTMQHRTIGTQPQGYPSDVVASQPELGQVGARTQVWHPGQLVLHGCVRQTHRGRRPVGQPYL